MSITIQLLALILLLAQSNRSHSLVGKWESVEATEGPRIILEFARDGRFVAAAGWSGSGTYKVDGNLILIDDGGGAQSVELKIEPEALVLKDEEDELRFLRPNRQAPKTPTNSNPVGKWVLKGPFFHGDNGLWTIELTADGRCRTRIQSEPRKGRYQIKGRLVTIRISGIRHTSSLRFEDAFLILESRSNVSYEGKYRRLEW